QFRQHIVSCSCDRPHFFAGIFYTVFNCQSGVWKASDSGVYVEMGSYETKSTRGVTYQIPGTHKFCLVSGLMSAGDNGTCKIRPSGNDWFLDMVGYNGSSTQTCWVSCLD
ncbi:hypothetical protein C6985_11915, partial [Escherichia coli]